MESEPEVADAEDLTGEAAFADAPWAESECRTSVGVSPRTPSTPDAEMSEEPRSETPTKAVGDVAGPQVWTSTPGDTAAGAVVVCSFAASPLLDSHSAQRQENFLTRLSAVVDVGPAEVSLPSPKRDVAVLTQKNYSKAAQVRRDEKAEFALLVKQVTGHRSNWQSEFRHRQRELWREPLSRRDAVCAH